MQKKCSCGSQYFEDIDVTPGGYQEKRYFTRCKQCGLVVAAVGCSYSRHDGTIKRTYKMLAAIFS